MSRLQNVNIKAQDSASIDSAGRWRVSNPVTIYDGKQLFDNLPLFWDERLESGLGISAAHSTLTASTVITSTLNTAGTFTRQTFMRFNYSPGKSQQIQMTGVLDRSGGGTGVKRRIGQFDDNNGLFFELDDGTTKVVRRTNVTGTPVDNPFPQSEWNVDKLNGSGPSGITIDWTKIQIFELDYEWLGGGSIRMGLIISNLPIVVHIFEASNVLDKVYMSTPNLPLRYQMITTSSSPVSTLEAICSTVISEGGTPNLGITRYASTEGAHVNANTEDVIYAILGMRLRTTHIGMTIKLLNASVAEHTGAKKYEWFMVFNPVVAGTFNYVDDDDSAIQIAKGATENTVTFSAASIKFDGGFSSSAQRGGPQTNAEVDSARQLGLALDDTRDTIVLCVRPVGGSQNLDVEGSLTWRELS